MKKHIGLHHINNWQKFVLFSVIIILGTFGVAFSLKAYPKVFKTNIIIEKNIDISPKEAVTLNFSIPVFTQDYTENIKIIPEENIKLAWKDSNKKLEIIPVNFWNPGLKYQVILPPGENIMFSEVDAQSIYFYSEKYPEVLKIYPKDGEIDVAIDIEDPIQVSFKKSVEDFSLKFLLNSKSDFYFENDPNKSVFKLMPKEEMSYETDYFLEIYAKYKFDKEAEYEKIFESHFKTIMPPEIVWDKDKNVRLEQVKKYAVAKIKTGKYVDINLTAQIMSIFEEGKLLNSFIISSGKRGMDTPKGETRIYNKFPRAFSQAYGLFMPFWMALASDGKFGIHELPEWPGGYKEGEAHLGIPVSHGCVRLGVGPAEEVYNFAEIGTPVVIY